MTTDENLIGASSAKLPRWNSINWAKIGREVHRMQTRIAKAINSGLWGKAKVLQRLLTHSLYGKLMAVKRVTSNKGKSTPGIDEVIWTKDSQKISAAISLKTTGYKPLPLKRVHIPKKNGKRPLSIPSMYDRAMQALYLLAIEPIAECKADLNSYGFRPKRCAADAIAQCFIALGNIHSAKYILEGDIKSCFDQICHQWLLDHVPMDKLILSKWLKAGYVFKQRFFHSKTGTPQGGIISPCLLTFTLSGLEQVVKSACIKSDKVNVVTYADDFIITASDPKILEEKVKPIINDFLSERGLTLSREKTMITHIEKGFDFLGFNIRKYGNKLLIKPSKENIKSFRKKLKKLRKASQGSAACQLILHLNARITGWANYYRYVVSKKIFNNIDAYIFQLVWSWARREHRNKSKTWIVRKYFQTDPRGRQLFSTKDPRKRYLGERLFIKLASDTPIIRYIKVRQRANPFLEEYRKYFRGRWAYIKSLTKPATLISGCPAYG